MEQLLVSIHSLETKHMTAKVGRRIGLQLRHIILFLTLRSYYWISTTNRWQSTENLTAEIWKQEEEEGQSSEVTWPENI